MGHATSHGSRPRHRLARLACVSLAGALLASGSSVAAQTPEPGTGEALPERGALAPGTTYRSDAVGVHVRFTATAGWAVLFESPESGFALIDQGRPPIGGVSVVAFDGQVFEDPCDEGSLGVPALDMSTG
jgi:hypothetical protein